MARKYTRKPIPVTVIGTDFPPTNPLFDFKVVAQHLMSGFTIRCNKPHYSMILHDRFLEQLTLKEIGDKQGVTKECIRLLCDMCLDKLRKLINGETLYSPSLKVDISFLRKLTDFRNQHILGHSILKKDQITQKLLEEYPSTKLDGWFDVLMSVEGFDLDDCAGIELYKKKRIYSKTLKDNMHDIMQLFKDNVMGITYSELLKKTKIKSEVLSDLLKIFGDKIEITQTSSQQKYQLILSELNSVCDAAYRFLRNNTKATDLVTLKEELTKNGYQVGDKLNLCIDPRFSCLGKSGIWGLAEWDMDTRPIYQIMEDYIRTKKGPVPLDELQEEIIKIRPDSTPATIQSFVSIYTNLFSKIEDKKIILKSWEKKYTVVTPKHRCRPWESQKEFDQELFSILGTKKIYFSELYQEFLKRSKDIHYNTLVSRLKASKIVKKSLENLPYPTYEIIKSIDSVDYIDSRKDKRILETATALIQKNGSIRLSILVDTLCNMGYKSPLIYQAIQKSKLFKTSMFNGKAKLITMR